MITEWSVLNKKYNTNIRNFLIFEIKSFVGRLFANRYPPNIGNIKLLNLGCGPDVLKGWVNSEFFSYSYILREKTRVDWAQDYRFSLKCKNDYWDGVFCQHTLEHLWPPEALSLLKEIHRTMKKGAWLRLSVPDLKKYIDYYNNKKSPQKFKTRWPIKAAAIWSISSGWGHNSTWDYKLLSDFLKKSGFEVIKKESFNKGSDKRLLKDRKRREWESLYIEAQK